MSLKTEAILDVSHAVVKCESSNIGRSQRDLASHPGVMLVRSTRPLIKPRPKGESVKARPKGDGSPSVAALGVLVLCTSLDGLAHTGSWCCAPALTALTAKPRPLGLGPTDQGLSTTVPLGQDLI